MDTLAREVRYALRRLAGHRGICLAAVASIGLALATATVVVSTLDALVLRHPAFREPSTLVHTEERLPGGAGIAVGVRLAELEFWRTQRGLFAAFEGYQLDNAVLAGAGTAQAVTIAHVTDGLMPMLGVVPSLGRTLEPGDAGTARVVLSHAVWRRGFGADPSLVGQVIRLNDVPHTVVGVMPPTFRFPFTTNQAWVPASLVAPTPGQRPAMYRTVARLAAGVSPALAASRMDDLRAGVSPALPGAAGRRAVVYLVGARQVSARTRQALWMLVGAVTLLVLVATANVVNLLVTAADRHARQLAVCAALGASWWRLLGGRVIEASLLTGLGVILGLVAAYAVLPAVVAAAPLELWVLQVNDIAVNWRIAGVMTTVALACGLAAACVAVARARMADPQHLLAGGRVQLGVRGQWVVAGQVAAVLAVLMGATGLARSYRHMTSVHPGFDVDRVVSTWIDVPAWRHASSEAAVQHLARLHEALAAVPGVAAVSMTPDGVPPAANWEDDIAIDVEGRGVVVANDPTFVMTIGRVSPGHFETLGIPIHAGRGIEPADRRGGEFVAVISQSLARRFWPGGDAIGGRFRVKDNAEGAAWEDWHTVVGVVGDVYAHDAIAAGAPMAAYFATAQAEQLGRAQTFSVRAAGGDPAALIPSLTAALRSVDASLPVEFETARQQYAQFFAAPRFYALLTGWIAALGLVLAGVGVGGISLVSTAGRTAEFGVRLAVGAQPRDLVWLVLRGTATLVGGGILLGLPLAGLAALALRGLVTGVGPADPRHLVGATALLVAVAFAGCWWSARRALRVTPIDALRAE